MDSESASPGCFEGRWLQPGASEGRHRGPESCINTCAVARERPRPAVRQTSGHLLPGEGRRHKGMQIGRRRLPWPRWSAQKITQRAPWVDRPSTGNGTNNRRACPGAARGGPGPSARRPQGSSFEETLGDLPLPCFPGPPGRRRTYSAWGVDLRLAATTPAPSGIVPEPRAAKETRTRRPPATILDEINRPSPKKSVLEVTLLGQNVNSYGRRVRRQGSRSAKLLRGVAATLGGRGAWSGSASPSPHLRATSPDDRDRGPWRPTGKRDAEALHMPAAVRLGRGPQEACARAPLPPRPLPGHPSPTCAPRSPHRPRSTTDIIGRLSPARPKATFADTPRPGSARARFASGVHLPVLDPGGNARRGRCPIRSRHPGRPGALRPAGPPSWRQVCTEEERQAQRLPASRCWSPARAVRAQ